MYKAKQIAEYFILRAERERKGGLSNLKIQKLLYYAQGYSLAKFRAPIFEEPIMAWNLGPVVVEVYEEFKQFGEDPVKPEVGFSGNEIDPNSRILLDEVFRLFGQFSAFDLVRMTHNEPPWRATKINKEISHKILQDYFSRQIN